MLLDVQETLCNKRIMGEFKQPFLEPTIFEFGTMFEETVDEGLSLTAWDMYAEKLLQFPSENFVFLYNVKNPDFKKLALFVQDNKDKLLISMVTECGWQHIFFCYDRETHKILAWVPKPLPPNMIEPTQKTRLRQLLVCLIWFVHQPWC